jgi:putative cobalt transporter subunit CbtB
MSSTTALPSTTPVVISLSKTALLLTMVTILALATYYFVGVDQGALSVFGNNTVLHEFMHDGRHFLGFPCH